MALSRLAERGSAADSRVPGAATRGERARHSEPPGASARAGSGTPFEARDWLFFRSGERAEFVAVMNVTAITADADYSRVRTVDGAERLAHVPLGDWERRLPASEFLRIHRSSIVNLTFVTSIEPWTNGGFLVHVRDITAPLTMSRRYAGRMRARMG
jgi:DNA-binding LytR/AlgR family response regulator